MACIKNANGKKSWSQIKPKGQLGDHNYMLHTPCMTRVRKIVFMPIIMF
jgi:hypothetical protein